MTKRPRTKSQQSEMVYDAHHFGILLDTREIFVSPPIDDSLDEAMIDHTTCSQFIRNVRLLDGLSDGRILIHMATCGGDWCYGMAMYDAIQASRSETVVLSYAHARSMSSVIPQAATWRVLMPHADYLVHEGTYGDIGTFKGAMANAAWYKKSNSVMLGIYADRIGEATMHSDWNRATILRWLRSRLDQKQEFYMTPRQAVERGFADAVLGDAEFETIEQLRKG